MALQQFLDDFTETGAGSANLARDSDNVLTGNTEVGLRLAAELAAARAHGFEELIVEANFWDGIEAPDDWERLPDLLTSSLGL